MTFLNPLGALIPKVSFSYFAKFWVQVTSGARGSVSVGLFGARQLSLFFWRGAILARVGSQNGKPVLIASTRGSPQPMPSRCPPDRKCQLQGHF